MMSSDRERVAAEIAQAATLGLEDDWELITRTLVSLRAKSDPNASRSVLDEFGAAARGVADAIDRRFVKLLTLCQGYPARPDEVIEPVAEALRALIERLRNYGGERAAGATSFGRTQSILVRSNEATEFAEKALEKARINALQGYAGGRLVFPRSEWPSEDDAPALVLAAAKPSKKPLKRISTIKQRDDGADTKAIGDLRSLAALCVRWKAADQLPAEKRRAAIKLKRELSDQIAWSAETIRQIISGRHVVANALAEAGRVDPFWRKYWA